MSRSEAPLSSISYNTTKFLNNKLNELTRNGVLDFWCYVAHHGEHLEDGCKEKDHIHIYLVPGTRIDKRQLRNEFIEIKKRSLPLGFMPMQHSKWDDWYLYGLHDSEYLDSKGQKREYHYSDNDMIRSDDTFYWDLVHRIDRTKINPLGAVIRAAQSGMSFADFVTSNQLSLLQVRSAQFVFDQVQRDNRVNMSLKTAGHQDHEPIEPDTGEYISPIDISD